MKKGLPILLLMVAMTLAGCSSNTSAKAADTEKTTAESTRSENESEQSSAEKRKVIITTGGTGEPYSLLSSDGKDWTGIDAEMWSEIAKRTGWDIEVKQAEFSSLFGELDAGRVDVAANCFATTKVRMDKYMTSHPYYGDAQCVIVNEDKTDINTFEALKGVSIGVTQGQASQVSVEKMAETYGWNVVVYETSDTGYQDLHLKRIDAMATTDSLVHKYEKTQNMKFHILDTRLLANNVAYYFQQNEKGKELCEEVNQVLDKMMEDGTTSKIITKWMYSDMTQMIHD
ncbi:transporter substrate-binding domain-containing protein [Lacrimispora aerotolerans]|jgi:ABC-type amino acid transport substrate-binding protein|uniref:transporter substrate-binding domain-containing protein n=1 Tax=Lacrimispora aerotolerans TaxID=36832 RepID=UPI00047DC4FB|nr:transporter substrate-binding domain-containing protein [Lacrimispora aerotolerans]